MGEFTLYECEEPDLSPFEQQLYDEITIDEPWALVEEFAELTRVSGTDGERAAAEYLTSRLNALDIPHERFDPELYISQPQGASVSVTSPTQVDLPSAKTVAFSNSDTVTGEALYFDPSSSNELAGAFDVGLDLDDLDQEVAGKIVIVESILPINAITELADAGAAGFIGIHPHETEPHEGIASPVWGGVPNPWTDDHFPDIAVDNLSRQDGDRLLSQIREHGSVEISLAADTNTGWFECPVVLAQIEGESDPANDDFVLLHGHYDSWHEGVTDNATGDAGLLESARVFEEYAGEIERDLWVAWWPGHSTGRYAGSTWFADEFAHELEGHCIAHVNMDSPGVKDATEFLSRPKWMPDVDGLCRETIREVTGKSAEQNRPPRAGDYSFNNIGITGMSLQSCIPAELRAERDYHQVGGSGGHADAWHLTTDTIDKADPDVLKRDIQVFVTAVSRLLNAEVLPFDHRHTLEHFDATLERYEEDAEGTVDLTPIRDAIETLETDLEQFYTSIDAGEISPTDANNILVELSRLFTRLDHTEREKFQQDPAVYRPPLTRLGYVTEVESLSEKERRFARTHLKRACNEVAHEFQSAARILRRVLE